MRDGGVDSALIQERKKRIVEKYGPWSAHNILLGGDVYTIGKGVAGDEVKLRRILQCVSDWSSGLDGLRVLDLACLEGLYAVELARHGAKVVGIEGREANIAKARFAQEVLGLKQLEFHQDDVRNLGRDQYGEFDVVLCLGILYHLDEPDVFFFLEDIAEVCRGIVLVDTHISPAREKSCLHKGKTYWGKAYREHDAGATPAEKARRLWASLDNPESFWFTRPSLYNALSHVGFTTVYECHMPPELEKPADRVTLLGVKGQRRNLFTSPILSALPIEDLAEGA